MKLAELAWPQVADLNRDTVILYPIAALEQHSHHLPFFTDSILCDAVATRIENALPDRTLLLPVQWLGASTHHLGMAGSLSADWDTHIKLICEPLRCLLRHGFQRAFVLNGHGGNIDGYHLALRQLAIEFPDALLAGASYWELAETAIAATLNGTRKSVGHACEFETALIMHLRPDLVHHDQIRDDDVHPVSDPLRKAYIPLDMKRQTRQGGAGQATSATPETGKKLLDHLVAKGVETIQAFHSHSRQF